MFKVGFGIDIHAFNRDHELDNSFITVCGIKIPYKYGIVAHSDGDVGLHSLTDAILGATSNGSIGVHFKNTDPQWKDAASDLFVKHAVGLMKEKGYSFSNIDITIVAQEPRIMPHAAKMLQNIAMLCDMNVDDINIKATTSEWMGFLGRKEGIAGFCNISIYRA